MTRLVLVAMAVALSGCSDSSSPDEVVNVGSDGGPIARIDGSTASTLTCSDLFTTKLVDQFGVTETHYFGVYLSGSFDPASSAPTAWVCDYQCFGSSCNNPCPEGFTCTTSGVAPPFVWGALPKCSNGNPVQALDGRLYVSCGARSSRLNKGETVAVLSGSVAQTVFVH